VELRVLTKATWPHILVLSDLLLQLQPHSLFVPLKPSMRSSRLCSLSRPPALGFNLAVQRLHLRSALPLMTFLA